MVGCECYSFLDGFSRYNHVHIAQEDQIKTTFTTNWGNFASRIMLFGLCNAPTTFQQVMIEAFQNSLRKDIEIFLNDFCVYEKEVDHPQALAHFFTQCSKFGISLNIAKCQFVVPYGKLLGHIVSADGIGIDPNKITLIENFSRL